MSQSPVDGLDPDPHLLVGIKELISPIRKTSDFPGLNIGGRKFNNIRYADDTVLFTVNSEALQLLAEAVNKNSKDAGLEINVKKTKTMIDTADQGGGREDSGSTTLRNGPEKESVNALWRPRTERSGDPFLVNPWNRDGTESK
ncbi:endonuclease-reverse transcriptase, partial [Elysia marginata]